MIAALAAVHPDRMEIAHAQYYGRALQNLGAAAHARTTRPRGHRGRAAEERLRGKVRIDTVPDYYARFPKARRADGDASRD